MKKTFHTALLLTALALALALCVSAFAETAEPEAPELPAIEDAQPGTPDEQPATDDAQPDAQAPQAGDAASDSAALQDALDAYRSAKQSSRLEDLESELNGYVESGKLTQEQADLILDHYKQQAEQKRGGRGYGKGSRGGRKGFGGKGGRGSYGNRGGRGMRGYDGRSGATPDGSSAGSTAYEGGWTVMPNVSNLEGI